MNILKHSFDDNFRNIRINHKLKKLVKQRDELTRFGEQKTGQIARLCVDIQTLEDSLRQPDERPEELKNFETDSESVAA